MATVTDSLETLLKMNGLQAYLTGFNKAAEAAEKLAKNQEKHKKTADDLQHVLGELGVAHAFMAGRALAAGFIIAESIKNFREDEDAIFRTTVVLRNLGNSYPIGPALEFANAMEVSTGIAGEQILEVEALLKRFGAADDQIQSLTKTILDFSAGAGVDLKEASRAVGHALVGNTRILRNMGIEVKLTGNRMKDLLAVQQKLDGLYKDSATARLNTLSGAFGGLTQALSGLLSVVGDKLSTVLVPALHAVTALINWISANAPLASALAGAAIGRVFGPVGAAIGAVAGLGLGLLPSRPNAAEAIGTGRERLATEGTLQQIEQNTSKMVDALVQRVLGGPGTVAKGASTLRDFKIAFGR